MRDPYIKTYGAGGRGGVAVVEGRGGGGSGRRLHVGNKRCEVLLITNHMRGSGTATKSLQAVGTVQGA